MCISGEACANLTVLRARSGPTLTNASRDLQVLNAVQDLLHAVLRIRTLDV
jgi:hypothetical protein